MRYLLVLVLVPLCAVAALAGVAHADEVYLANGDVLRGNILSEGEVIVLDHVVLGQVRVQRDRITGMSITPNRVLEAAGIPTPNAPVGGQLVMSPAPQVGVIRAPEAAVPVAAAAPCDVCAKPADDPCCPPKKDPCKPWSFLFNLGVSLQDGNTDRLDFTFDGEAKYEQGPTKFEAALGFVYGQTDGADTANRWAGKLRYERKFTNNDYAFGQVLFQRDEFQSLEYRFPIVAGYGRYFIQGARQDLKAEVGGGVTIEKRFLRDQTIDPTGYVGVDYRYTWNDGSELTSEVDFLPNFSDFDLSLTTWQTRYARPICDGLDLTVTLRLDYVIEPPDDAENLDLLLIVGLRLAL